MDFKDALLNIKEKMIDQEKLNIVESKIDLEIEQKVKDFNNYLLEQESIIEYEDKKYKDHVINQFIEDYESICLLMEYEKN